MSSDDQSKLRIVKSGNGGTAGLGGPDRLIRMLKSYADLHADDEQAIRALPGTVRQLEAYEDIVVEGDKPDVVTVLVDDLACRYKITAEGHRQILSFHIAGDIPDMQSLFLHRMDHSLCTLEPSIIWQIPHQAMLDLLDRAPRITRMFWRVSLVEASIFREWITNVGQREAKERIAHVLCEIMTRMKAVGLADGKACRLPITQAELGDATGMSNVHVNRSLQALRRERLIHWQAGALTILDWERLEQVGEFDPAYLHLRSAASREIGIE
jgi:CRP-like cAMP-binding protein